MMLEARSVSVTAGGRMVVSGANLAVDRGELVGLLGPNGAGKSTLIRALAGIIPHQGEILLAGQPIQSFTSHARARKLAYLPQERRVEWAVTAGQVAALGRHCHQRGLAGPSAEDRRVVAAALAEVGAQDIAGRPANALSGGELARILLARALAVGAPLLLADEPIAALDPFHQLHVMEILRARATAGCGILAVLHDMTLAARFLDRVILLDRGTIIADGAPREVLTSGIMEDVYGVTPLIGEHEGARWLLPWRRGRPSDN
jgi:iron complex transport system ATP-binding protein